MGKLTIAGLAAAMMTCVAGAASAAPEGVRETYYYVHGSTVDEMNKVIRANAPRGGRSRGMGFIDFDRSYTVAQKDGVCRIDAAKVATRVTLILPKWRPGSKPEGRVARKWRALERLIRDHEYKHVRIAQRYGRLMESRLSKLKSQDGCWSLNAEAEKVIQATIRQHVAAQRDFDRRELKRFGRFH